MARVHIPAFQLTAYSRQPMTDSMQLARETLSQAGAMVADIKRFSNKQIVFQVNVRLGEWEQFLRFLLAGELHVEPPEIRADLATWADDDGDLFGTVTVVVSGDDHERADLIPDIPG